MNPKKHKNQIIQQIIVQYFLVLFAFVVIYFLSISGAYIWCHQIIWQPYDRLYIILSFVKENLMAFASVTLLAGWTLITCCFMAKSLRNLNEVIVASQKLCTAKTEPLTLSADMKTVQDELNLFREQALRSELLAKEAEQRKNDLIVYLAHDLKTPLTSVIGYLTLLHDEPEISYKLQEKYTHIALEKALRLEDLINEFFDITRFNLTVLSLEWGRTNLSRMLEQVVYEFQPILAEKKLTWDVNIAANVEILCDPDKLERVFDNLIRNAINYSYSNSQIHLSMKTLDEQVEIQVSNHGKTIPADKLSHIFEQFFRLDSSRASATGGAGLGLAIAKEIVELHGGTIEAVSKNESICFTLLLPMTNMHNSL